MISEVNSSHQVVECNGTFTDEVRTYFDKYINKQKLHISGFHEKRIHPQGVAVWYGFWFGGIKGSFLRDRQRIYSQWWQVLEKSKWVLSLLIAKYWSQRVVFSTGRCHMWPRRRNNDVTCKYFSYEVNLKMVGNYLASLAIQPLVFFTWMFNYWKIKSGAPSVKLFQGSTFKCKVMLFF